MTQRSCPVCETDWRLARTVIEKNFDASRLNALSFASRKPPEFMSHQLVQCPGCGLVYAPDPPDQGVLARAYHASDFDSAEEADDAAAAYIDAIRPLLDTLPSKESVLEIGSGTGAFLERLMHHGFTTLVGVEPSPAAIAAAPPHRRGWLRESIFTQEDFAPASFDLICCFMTLEHVRDPAVLAASVAHLLKPGGAFAAVVHDYGSIINRALGRRSPIIDIEHMQLFSRRSVEQLLAGAGLEQVSTKSFRNRYALQYWARLMPLSRSARKQVDAVLQRTGLAGTKIAFNVGNMMCHGRRPNR